MIRAAASVTSNPVLRRKKDAAPEMYGPAAGLVPYDQATVAAHLAFLRQSAVSQLPDSQPVSGSNLARQ
ncbi:MAG TPA: hypothetical protein VHD36_22905 [Pirellulales bacterium]|nr:hypothetical protein [Pirellulales bacterium]